MLRGAMWDVGNAYLYTAIEAESESHSIGPTMLLERKDAIEEAQQRRWTTSVPNS